MAECIVLCLGYLSYVWNINISLMSGILVLCLGYLSYVWDINLSSHSGDTKWQSHWPASVMGAPASVITLEMSITLA